MLAIDLGVFHRRAHTVRVREAGLFSLFWISLALLFALGIGLGWFGDYGPSMRGVKAKEFLVGYLVELSLSVDNLFVFAVIFSYFRVPGPYQHRVLFLGILGALVFRAIFIVTGTWLIQTLHFTIYFFAAFLIFTGFKMLRARDKDYDPAHNPVLRLARRFMPVTDTYHEGRLFLRDSGRLVATPLFLVLLMIETTDVVFALDSIPAILVITQDTFIVYTSNVFAILGLRTFYFALAGFMRMFHYLSHGLSIILIFIGGKMFVQTAAESLGYHYSFPIELSLAVIAGILTVTVLLSVFRPPRETSPAPVGPDARAAALPEVEPLGPEQHDARREGSERALPRMGGSDDPSSFASR
jgi:tellurite resistance protein TerC